MLWRWSPGGGLGSQLGRGGDEGAAGGASPSRSDESRVRRERANSSRGNKATEGAKASRAACRAEASAPARPHARPPSLPPSLPRCLPASAALPQKYNNRWRACMTRDEHEPPHGSPFGILESINRRRLPGARPLEPHGGGRLAGLVLRDRGIGDALRESLGSRGKKSVQRQFVSY